MTAYLLFAAGFAAGIFVNQRDMPVAATCLGAALLLAGLTFAGVVQ